MRICWKTDINLFGKILIFIRNDYQSSSYNGECDQAQGGPDDFKLYCSIVNQSNCAGDDEDGCANQC